MGEGKMGRINEFIAPGASMLQDTCAQRCFHSTEVKKFVKMITCTGGRKVLNYLLP